eukprot:7377554-Prymnesium_polylepis.1
MKADSIATSSRYGSDSHMVSTWRRRPGKRLMVRRGRSALRNAAVACLRRFVSQPSTSENQHNCVMLASVHLNARIDVKLLRSGKSSGNHEALTTTKSSWFHPERRYAWVQAKKPWAMTLLTSCAT